MSTTRIQELNKYPKFKRSYKLAVAKWIEYRKSRGLKDFMDNDVDKIYAWWVQDNQIKGQMMFDFDGTMKEYKP